MQDQNNNLVPHLTVNNATAAIEFYKTALGFEEVVRMPSPHGKILHCELKRGPNRMFVADSFPEMGDGSHARPPSELGGSAVTIHLGVPDVDVAFAKALAAGATETMPLADMFWGDRYGKFIDPFGHHWSMSTHKEDVSLEENKKRAGAIFAKWAKQNE
ncbi:MAG: VOC family protein [Planctomycetota bacterium]|nr:VOC family protein [Planctomycetota bacterium]